MIDLPNPDEFALGLVALAKKYPDFNEAPKAELFALTGYPSAVKLVTSTGEELYVDFGPLTLAIIKSPELAMLAVELAAQSVLDFARQQDLVDILSAEWIDELPKDVYDRISQDESTVRLFGGYRAYPLSNGPDITAEEAGEAFSPEIKTALTDTSIDDAFGGGLDNDIDEVDDPISWGVINGDLDDVEQNCRG